MENNQTLDSNCSYIPLEKDKIEETVYKGSVFLAIECNFFNPNSLLNWLVSIEMNEYTQIAYKALCNKINPNDQYLSDSYHFLTKKPEYTLIALSYGADLDLPDRNTPENKNPILAHVCDSVIKFYDNPELKRNTALIISGIGNPSYIESKLNICFLSRNFPYLKNISKDKINKALVESDWITKFRYNEDLVKFILERVTYLQQNAPIYYAHVAYKEYYNVAVRLYKEKLLSKLTREELNTFNNFFSNIIDTKIFNYDDLSFKISLLNNEIAGYLLGFPIHLMIPDDEQIQKMLKLLSELGIEKYVKVIKEYTSLTYTIPLPFKEKKEVHFSNETDVIMESIDNYVPFDIVAYQKGNYIYRFTRIEFDKLIESKKNPWTNEWLPESVLSTIIARNKAAKKMNLPPPKTHFELLNCLKKGTLFEDSNDENSNVTLIDTPIEQFIPRLNEANIFLNLRSFLFDNNV